MSQDQIGYRVSYPGGVGEDGMGEHMAVNRHSHVDMSYVSD